MPTARLVSPSGDTSLEWIRPPQESGCFAAVVAAGPSQAEAPSGQASLRAFDPALLDTGDLILYPAPDRRDFCALEPPVEAFRPHAPTRLGPPRAPGPRGKCGTADASTPARPPGLSILLASPGTL